MNRKQYACSTMLMLLVGIAGASKAHADELRRRGMMGVHLAPLSDAARTQHKIPADVQGVLVTTVVPGTAADQAGIKPNDLIQKVGGDAVESTPGLLKTLRRYYGGDTVGFSVLREGQTITLDLTLAPRPQETSSDYEVVYDSAGAPGHRVRTMVTRPSSERKHPAVLIIPGLAPQSVELGFPNPHPFKDLIAALSKAGFVTMRVDRPGLGDSEGLDVHANTMQTDAAAFSAGLAALTKYDFVDARNVFILAHSSGAAIAPMIAPDSGVRGVMAYAAFTRPWVEHSLESSIRQWKLEGFSDAEIAENTAKLTMFLNECLTQKRAPADVLAAHPELAEFTSGFVQDELVFGLHYRYMQELAAAKLSDAWSRVGVPVLAVWGESDFSANRTDSELIAAAVNKAHPGKGTFLAMPRLDHFLGQAEDQEESFLAGAGGRFHTEFVDAIVKWMKEQSATANS